MRYIQITNGYIRPVGSRPEGPAQVNQGTGVLTDWMAAPDLARTRASRNCLMADGP